jgi:hypothetical protein
MAMRVLISISPVVQLSVRLATLYERTAPAKQERPVFDAARGALLDATLTVR